MTSTLPTSPPTMPPTSDNDFICPKCGNEYPIVARTAKGTCYACGAARRANGSRKSLFVQREKYNKFTLSALNSHKDRAKKVLDSPEK